MQMDMEMGGGLPAWLTTLSWAYIAVCALSAAAVAYDVFARGHRQPHRAMDLVWPLAALYLGPLALPVYRRFGRPHSPAWRQRAQATPAEDLTAAAVRSGLPGGVSSGIAHVVAVPFVVATGLKIAGLDMWAMVAIIAVLATAGIFAFERYVFTSRDRRMPGLRGMRPALSAAVLTVLAFDLGMLGWMVVLHNAEAMPAASDVRFTFLMQVGLVLGTVTAFPALRWLAARRPVLAA